MFITCQRQAIFLSIYLRRLRHSCNTAISHPRRLLAPWPPTSPLQSFRFFFLFIPHSSHFTTQKDAFILRYPRCCSSLGFSPVHCHLYTRQYSRNHGAGPSRHQQMWDSQLAVLYVSDSTNQFNQRTMSLGAFDSQSGEHLQRPRLG